MNPADTARSTLPHERVAFLLMRATRTPTRHCLSVFIFFSLLFVVFFSPALFGGKLLAVGGDGLYLHLPNFYSTKVLWDTMTFGGFPMMADPEVRAWYPPAMLLSLLPGTWNVFLIFGYVAASSFLYGYVFTITESRLAGLVSGIVFGLSGFMMAQLGNAVIIHSTAWSPLIIWSLEKLRRRLSFGWLALGSAGVALCLLGGQPQVFFYAVLLAIAYALTRGWNSPVGRWRYYLVVLMMIALGASLAGIQIIPTRELLSQSIRANYSFQDFVSYSLPRRQSLTLIFPYVFGGLREAGFLPYFGRDNQTELTGYVGLLPLLFVAVALFVSKQRFFCFFWLSVAIVSFLLVLGDATPLARAIYHLPILKSFRVPARHFMEFTFAISVLSGLGIAAVIKQRVSSGFVVRVIVIGVIGMIAALTFLLLNSNRLVALAAASGIQGWSLRPWLNRAVAIPLIVFVLGLVGLFFWYRRPTSILRSALLLCVLVIDLGSFGFFYQWRYFSVDKTALTAPANSSQFKDALQASKQRLMSYRCYRGVEAEMPAGLTRLWGIPNACGYNALILKRVSDLFPMIDQPDSPLPWTEPENKSLDLMAVRYFFLPGAQFSTDERGVKWLKGDMQFWLGSGCGKPSRQTATVTVPTPIQSTSVAIVSRLACSVQILDGAEIARVRMFDASGKVQTQSLLAGRDTSEWAYDCASVKRQVRHQRARVFDSFPAMMNDQHCEGHSYVTTLSLNGLTALKRIEFEWTGGQSALILDHLTLIDDSTRTSYPIDPSQLDSDMWRPVAFAGEARAYENLRAMPRAWLAADVVRVNPEQALQAIKTGTLPDGRSFDPRRTTLLEESVNVNTEVADSNTSASVISLTDTRMEVHTSSAIQSLLVTSDAWYPSWRVAVDDAEARLYRVDYALRGVVVPAGQHTARFYYPARSFYAGAMISAVSLLLWSAVVFAGLRFRKRLKT